MAHTICIALYIFGDPCLFLFASVDFHRVLHGELGGPLLI